MLHEPSAFADKYEAEAAHPLCADGRDAPRARWPIMWTIIGAVAVSVALWALIFIGARALWTFAFGG
jgi:hypothetical protein